MRKPFCDVCGEIISTPINVDEKDNPFLNLNIEIPTIKGNFASSGFIKINDCCLNCLNAISGKVFEIRRRETK